MENGTAEQPAVDAAKKPKLTRLKIESFRNVEPCVLRFGDGFNVLLGLNATGKTTLLELIAAALSFDFSKFKEEAFAVEYDLSFSTGSIIVSMRNERVERSIPEAPVLQVRDAERRGLSAKLQICSTTFAKAWTICADMFRGITSPSTWLEVTVDRAKGAVLGFNAGGVVPRELLTVAGAHVKNMAHDVQGLTIQAESLSFLPKVSTLFGFKTARLEMRLESKTGTRSSPVLRFGDFRFMFEGHDGSIIRHEDLSYGQKRLLAFYYYLAANPLTVIADEIVDGLHHLWIDAAIEAIGDRQAFLASQNPLLLDHLEFDTAEQVASTFITCRAERIGDDKRMSWSNMSTYDAERFFRAYQVDVKHVSEILLSKGLW